LPRFSSTPEYDTKKVRRIKDANMVLRCNTRGRRRDIVVHLVASGARNLPVLLDIRAHCEAVARVMSHHCGGFDPGQILDIYIVPCTSHFRTRARRKCVAPSARRPRSVSKRPWTILWFALLLLMRLESFVIEITQPGGLECAH
jgi:hypothetical protein